MDTTHCDESALTARVDGLIAALNMAGDDMDPTASAEADFAQMADLARQLERENAELRRRLRNVLDYLDPDSLEDQKSEPALRQEAQACFENARAALGAA